MALSGSSPKAAVAVREGETVADALARHVEETHRCYSCREPTDRYIRFRTAAGIICEFECVDCRQKRVRRQVDEGLRPESDLLPENFPERR